MTAASKRWLAMIHRLPCVVCLYRYGERRTSVESHHIEHVRGEHSDFATVPLCANCHDELHNARRREFYRVHKLDDIKLMAWTNMQIEELLLETWRKV